MIRLPTVQSQYDLFYSGDPVFAQLPEGATDDERKAYSTRWRIARERGDYADVIESGYSIADATKFVMRQLSGTVMRKLADLATSGKVGQVEMIALIFRLALVEIVNGPAFKFSMHEDAAMRPELASLGRMASADIVNGLDSRDMGIVSELSALVWERSQALRPKS